MFVLDLRGSVLSCAARSQEVAWPGLVDPKAAAAVWSEDMRSIAPDTDDPSEAFKATVDWNQLSQHAEAARKLVPVMRDFTQALEDMHRLASKLGIDDLYDTFRNPDEDEHGSLSYEDAAQHLIRLAADRLPHKVFTNMDRALLSYVVFAHMMLRPLYFTSGTEAREAATFSLTPLTWVKDLQTATAWMESQDSNSPLDSFIEKAREIVTFSEKYPPTRYAKSCQPFAESAALPNFNANDQLIIRVLKRALITERQSQMPIYADILSNVVQHLAVPEPGTPLVNLNVAVLKRLGAITPWENLVKLDPNLAPWGDKLPKLPRTHVLRSTDAPEAHAVDAVRHDFGTMPVYVIDADDAYELDDGVSIEQAPPANGQPSWWVHAHVADPTHCLPPKDVRAYKAFRRKETVYFPEKTWPLLPRNFLAQHHLSLGSAPEQRVMTFSTRMTGDGEVLGSLVRAGIVRNVVKTTYNVVSEILSGSPTKPSTPRMILSTFPTEKDLQDALGSNKLERNLSEVSASGREDLKQLYSLARAHMRKRVARGGIFWEYSSPSVNIYRSSKDTPIDDDNPERPYLYKGIPRVSMSIPGPGASLEPSDEESTILNPAGVLVSEMMIVANSSAAQHGRQHGLPLPFLGQKPPATTPEALQALYEERDPMTGRIPVRSLLDASSKVQFPAAYTSNKPVAHWALGIPEETGYTRVTSPLRRNLDLFTHWMLKGSLVKDFPTPRLTPELEDFYAQPAGRIRRLGNRATQHWINYVLSQEYKRWEDEGAAKHPHLEKLFTGLEGVVQRPPAFAVFSSQWHTAVFVPSLGIKVAAECGPRGPTLAVGDIVNIRLTACELL